MQISIVFVALAAISSAVATPAQLSKRNHQITFTNNCAQTVTPMLTSTGGPFIRLAALGRGGSASATVGESWLSGRAFGQTGQCSQPDGAGCTLLECDFSTTNFRQCNLSRVSGYNIPMGFSFDDGACGGNRCGGPDCPGSAAFSTPTNGGASLRQCNTPNVGMHVTFC